MRQALAAYEDAGATVVATLRRLYPVGTLVDVALGAQRKVLRISGHSTVRVGIVYGTDVLDGRPTQFSAGMHDAREIR